ncbi:MAG: hypothetical protein GTO00_09250 [Deltaproteobacteria bacterium]|nr:hypothetical protein [Deltaproteobacteria bacterium]
MKKKIRKVSKTRKHNILYKIARHYQDNPKMFDFMGYSVPKSLKTPACPLALIGRELGFKHDDLSAIASAWLNKELCYGADTMFYIQLNQCAPKDAEAEWSEDVGVCIRTLRKYAREIKAGNMV